MLATTVRVRPLASLHRPALAPRHLLPLGLNRAAGQHQAARETKSALTDVISKLSERFGRLSFQSRSEPAVVAQRDELLQLLLQPSLTPSDQQRASELVDALTHARVPFKEALLGGGPWVVLYTRGRLQLWRATFAPGRLLNRNNEASQDFDPTRRAAVNRAEYASGQVYITASGTYAPTDDSTSTPKRVDVAITAGSLHAFGATLPLPIRGRGTFDVLYLDDRLRVFRSGGSCVVQVRRDVLRRLQKGGELVPGRQDA